MKIAKLIVLSILLLSVSLSMAADESVGVVLGVAGNATITHTDKSVVLATRKAPLFENDVIESADNSRVQLRFNDGTLTTLGEKTALRVNSFIFNKKSPTSNNAQFELIKGAFRTVSGKLLKTSGAHFEVKTPVGVIGVRGTDFWGGYLEADNVDVLLIQGEHAVEVKNTSGSVLLQKAGEGATLKKDQSTLAVKVWPQAKVDKAVNTIKWPNGEVPTE